MSSLFTPMEVDAIGEIMNISLGSSATAVSNLLDHRVDITTPRVSIVNAEEFSLGDLDPAIGVEIKYVAGLHGSNIMLLKMHAVKVIVDILMGMETPIEEFELNELTLSAICEVMNQMMGASSTALSDFLGRVVNISTPETFDGSNVDNLRDQWLPVKEGPVVVVQFALSIEDSVQSEFINVMSVELAKEMISGFGLNEGEDASAALENNAQPEGNRNLNQAEIEAMLAAQQGAPAPAPSGGGMMSQEEIERMMSGMAQQQQPQQPAAPPQQPAAAYPPFYGWPTGPDGKPMPYPPYYAWPSAPPAEPRKPDQKVIQTTPPVMPKLEDGTELTEEQSHNLDLIMSVPLEIAVEIGRTRKKVQEIVSLSKGSLVVLDKLAGDQVDVYVNGKCIAQGDVVVIDDNFGIRITEILRRPGLEDLL